MYFQSDYILRTIEMIHTFFDHLLSMLDDALRGAELDRFLVKQCGLNLKTLDTLSVESLIAMLPKTPRLLLSEFLALRADSLPMFQEERLDCLYKAFRLLLSVGDENVLCELRFERFLSLYRALDERLTAKDFAAAFRFALCADAYSTAEDILFYGLSTLRTVDASELFAVGMEGLSSLLSYPETRLARGGLPSSEVRQAIDEIKLLQGAPS